MHTQQLALVLSTISAATCMDIAWTGQGLDGEWTNSMNWQPRQVPGSYDDVHIDRVNATNNGQTLVILAAANELALTVRSLSIAVNTYDGEVRLRVLSPLSVLYGARVGTQGVLEVSSGAAAFKAGTSSGQTASISGTLELSSGQLSGMYDVLGWLKVTTPAAKTLNRAEITVRGNNAAILEGVLQFAQSSIRTQPGIDSTSTTLQLAVVSGTVNNIVSSPGFTWHP